MDDIAQNTNQNSNNSQQTITMPQDDFSAQSQTQNQSPQQVQQPQVPISTPQKEIEPVGANAVKSEAAREQYIAPSPVETMPTISPEVSKHVEAVENPQIPKLTQEHKQAGIEVAKESVPVSTSASGAIQLPMTEKEALKIIKTTSYSDSKHWLAMLIDKVYRQLAGK